MINWLSCYLIFSTTKKKNKHKYHIPQGKFTLFSTSGWCDDFAQILSISMSSVLLFVKLNIEGAEVNISRICAKFWLYLKYRLLDNQTKWKLKITLMSNLDILNIIFLNYCLEFSKLYFFAIIYISDSSALFLCFYYFLTKVIKDLLYHHLFEQC